MIKIEDVFSDINDENFKKMQKIIDFRQRNILKKLPVLKRDENYIYCESHHIIPKSWFKIHKLAVDNSIHNLVNLTAKEHVLVHIYLRKYFENRDIKMFFCMTDALLKMLHGNQELLDQLQTEDDKLLQFVSDEIIDSKKHISEMRSLSNMKFWNSLSDEECLNRKTILRERQRNFWKNMSENERQTLIQKIKLNWNNKSLDEITSIKHKISNSLKEYNYNAKQNMSDEQKKERNEWYSQHAHEIWDKRNEQEKIELGRKISKSLKNNKNLSQIRKEMHKNMTPEKKEKRKQLIKENNKERWKDRNSEKIKVQLEKMTKSNRGRIWMYNNLGDVIHPKKDEEEKYLKIGYIRGRKLK